MKAGKVYFTFTEMRLQNGNEINYLVENESKEIEEK